MIYGGFAHLTDTAIGGRAHYRPGDFTVRIREDRLPAPLFGASFGDGTSLTVLDASPDGATTKADSHDDKAVPMVDERFRFGALGAEERGSKLAVGYWFPGSEGEVTYAGNTYPGGQLHHWRLRFHPLKTGFVQRYHVDYRFGHAERFPEFYPAAWRWAWRTLQPRVNPQDLTVARRALVDTLAGRVQSTNGLTGIPNFVDAVQAERARFDEKAVLGFTGKNLEAANYLLHEADLDVGPRGERLWQLGNAIADSFVKLQVAPPVGEGFNLKTGQPVCAIGNREVFLRSFGDDVKALLKAYRRENHQGRKHAEWLRWCREFGDWLLTQQQSAGGFPRSWEPGTGKVVSASPNSSYNAVPLLILLHQIIGERKYLDAAQRAAEFCWGNGQERGLFVGGTIDNPDVLDKEAATLSLEAYLMLHEATHDPKWLQRSIAAAQFAETWVYCWNIPMPDDEDNAALHWKKGVPTAGLQLISTGHSLVDAYMAFDADEFADLFLRTKDPHFLEVARLLLHNTKAMLALPGRTYDLAGPGWQQEHWSLAPLRGIGLHRGWLPWVTTSHLNGIFGLMDLNPELFAELAAAQPVQK